MKKKLFLLIATITVIFSSLSFYQFNSNKVEAATIGQQLKNPEEGWKRYDDTDLAIKYQENAWEKYSGEAVEYGGGSTGALKGKNSKVWFDFIGDRVTIIANMSTGYSENIEVKIDDQVHKTSARKNISQSQSVLFTIEDLPNTRHKVEISVIKPGTSIAYDFRLDAIDINESGELLYPDDVLTEIIKLNKTLIELNVGSSESLVATIEPENATNKTIKWTSTNPEIATVDDNGNVIGKSPGKVTITAETTDGSNLKATAEVTVKEAEVEGNKGILKLTTTTGDLHEYDLSRTEINNFIAWLDKKGEGKPYYEFKLNVTTGNIKSRTEYIMFDEIVSFVIDEY